LFIIQAIVFFVWVPGQPIDWSYAGPVLIGVVVTLVVGEILLWLTKRRAVDRSIKEMQG
jgi:glutamate:GABA antiporter